MFASIRKLFDSQLSALQGEQGASESDYQLATAALLLEMAQADEQVSSDERAAVQGALQRAFELDDSRIAELVRLAGEERDAATCLYDFTRAINGALTPQQKVRIIELLWQVAFADGALDRYEDHLARKIADLLHLGHAEFIGAKLRMAEAAGIRL